MSSFSLFPAVSSFCCINLDPCWSSANSITWPVRSLRLNPANRLFLQKIFVHTFHLLLFTHLKSSRSPDLFFSEKVLWILWLFCARPTLARSDIWLFIVDGPIWSSWFGICCTWGNGCSRCRLDELDKVCEKDPENGNDEVTGILDGYKFDNIWEERIFEFWTGSCIWRLGEWYPRDSWK